MQAGTQQHAETAAVGAGSAWAWLKLASGALGALFVNFPKALAVLCCLMALDYITGLAAGWASKSLESGAAFRGLMKKLVVGGAGVAGFFISGFIPDVVVAGFDLGKVDIGSAICGAFALSEIISIFENIGRSGQPLPGPVRIMLARLKKMDDDGNPTPKPSNENPATGGSILRP